ncbi:peritrophin-1 [Megachile rotundata]|uniref:peritrophin-1 n=1 Tax=Megachile rotundata TaxID=143995 RepID=UPI003FD11A75
MKTVAFAVVFLAVVYIAQAIECPPQNEADVTLLQNPDDCSSFYLCNDGIPYLMLCPEGLHFNPRLRVCDLPANARCLSGTSTTEEPEEPSTTPEEPKEPSTTPEEPEEPSTTPEEPEEPSTTPEEPEEASTTVGTTEPNLNATVID